MYRLKSDCFRFILNNIICNVLCHKLYFSIYERDNSFNYYFVILFFNSNLKNFSRKLFCLFVCKFCISESWVFLIGLFSFVEITRVLWLFFETWCFKIFLLISRKLFEFYFSYYLLVSNSRVLSLTILLRVSVRYLGLNIYRGVLLYLEIVLICIVLRW